MASKPRWKGTLMLGLVSVPVHLYATSEKKSKAPVGHGVHRACQTQAESKKWCPICDKAIPEDELMKGYDVPPELLAQPAMTGKSKFVELTDDEIGSLKVESSKVIRITRVADESELEPLMITETSYLVSDGTAAAAEAEAVLVDALEGKVAVGSLTMSGRERPVAVMVYRGGFVLHVLRTADAMKDLPDRIPLPAPNPEMVQIAHALVESMAGPLDLAHTRDEYADGLRAMVIEKAQLTAGETLPVMAPVAAPKVVSLMEQLKASMAALPPKAAEKASRTAPLEKIVAKHPQSKKKATRKAS